MWDNSITDNIFQSLSDKFLLKDKGDISDFHGICITKDENRNMHMTQPGLKQAIITNLGLDNLTCKLTPADSALHTDTNGPAWWEQWIIWCIIGKLNFLAQNTWQISAWQHTNVLPLAQDQPCYMKQPSSILYTTLLTTKEKAIILSSTPDYKHNMYVDVDFAGTWHKEYAEL